MAIISQARIVYCLPTIAPSSCRQADKKPVVVFAPGALAPSFAARPLFWCVRSAPAVRLTRAMASESIVEEKLGVRVERNPSESRLSQLGVRSWPKWGCPPSKFPWTYADKETCYLLKGKVKVYGEGSSEYVEIGAGDLVVFPKEFLMSVKSDYDGLILKKERTRTIILKMSSVHVAWKPRFLLVLEGFDSCLGKSASSQIGFWHTEVDNLFAKSIQAFLTVHTPMARRVSLQMAAGIMLMKSWTFGPDSGKRELDIWLRVNCDTT